MKVTAILKGRVDKQGTIPIQIRIADGDKPRKYVATRIRVAKTQFKNGRVVAHANAALYNETIKRLIITQSGKAINGETKSKQILFSTYAKRVIAGWEKEKKESTIRQLTSSLETFNSHNPGVKLHELTPELLERYKNKRLATVSGNTAWSSFKFVRTILNQALRDGTLATDPAKGFKRPGYKTVRKVYLVPDELAAIDKVLLGSPFAFYGHWFLIACYTGLRVGDLLKFNRKEHIVNGRLVLYTSKTDEVVSLPLADEVLRHFEAVNYTPLSCAAETYREKLKLVAAAAGIQKHISTHTARHTFGVLCASRGLRQEVTAKLMGHSDLKSTATYYQLASPVMDDEYSRLFTKSKSE